MNLAQTWNPNVETPIKAKPTQSVDKIVDISLDDAYGQNSSSKRLSARVSPKRSTSELAHVAVKD